MRSQEVDVLETSPTEIDEVSRRPGIGSRRLERMLLTALVKATVTVRTRSLPGSLAAGQASLERPNPTST